MRTRGTLRSDRSWHVVPDEYSFTANPLGRFRLVVLTLRGYRLLSKNDVISLDLATKSSSCEQILRRQRNDCMVWHSCSKREGTNWNQGSHAGVSLNFYVMFVVILSSDMKRHRSRKGIVDSDFKRILLRRVVGGAKLCKLLKIL